MKPKPQSPATPLFYNLLRSLACLFLLVCYTATQAQKTTPYVRIAKIVVDSTQLALYKVALKEHAETAVRVEPGVLSLYAVYDTDAPTHVTVFEIYASKAAYDLHIKTPHFKTYKTSTQHMVQSLQLTDVVPIALERKAAPTN